MLNYILSGIVLASCLWPGSVLAADRDGPQEVFRKDVGGGTEIVVTRQLVDRAAGLESLLPDRIRRADAKAYVVAVAIRRPGGEEVRIGSRVQIEGLNPRTGFCVLDALVDDGEILISFGAGTYLGLWRIAFSSPFSDDAIAWLDKWQVSALGDAVGPKILEMKLSRLPDRRWQVSVVDLRVAEHPVSVFEQAPDEWKMVLVKGFWKAQKPGQ